MLVEQWQQSPDITGTKYSKGSIVFCTIEDDIPVFGKIVDIIVILHDDCLFILHLYVVHLTHIIMLMRFTQFQPSICFKIKKILLTIISSLLASHFVLPCLKCHLSL